MAPLPDPNIVTAGQPGPPAKVAPQPGMIFPVTATADPTGKILNGASALLYLPSASYGTAIPAACTFSTQYITYCTYDVTVTGFTGGTQPSGIVFGLNRIGADGVAYPVIQPDGTATSLYLSGTGTISIDVGPGFTDNFGSAPTYVGQAHNVFTPQAQVTWKFTGGTANAPVAATFSMSVYGR